MERYFFYEEIMDRPARRRIIEDFLESLVHKPHKEMIKLTRDAIKAHKKDEALQIFLKWWLEEIKKDKNMQITNKTEQDYPYPQS